MKRQEVLETLIVLSLVCIIANLIFAAGWALWVALILLTLGLFDNPVARFICQLWMKFATIIGQVNSKIILGLVFYLILTPVALLYRLFIKEGQKYFKDKTTPTTFIDANRSYDKELFERPW